MMTLLWLLFLLFYMRLFDDKQMRRITRSYRTGQVAMALGLFVWFYILLVPGWHAVAIHAFWRFLIWSTILSGSLLGLFAAWRHGIRS